MFDEAADDLEVEFMRGDLYENSALIADYDSWGDFPDPVRRIEARPYVLHVWSQVCCKQEVEQVDEFASFYWPDGEASDEPASCPALTMVA